MRKILLVSIGICSVIATAHWPSIAVAEDEVFAGKPPTFKDYGYGVIGSAWQFKDSETKAIFVCWENPVEENLQERNWIENQIKSTWQRYSEIEFRGWQKCGEKNFGIRVLFADQGAHVKAIGRRLDRLKNGMVLNIQFQKWNQSCTTNREACIRSIATHEFGHALGFAHEQNRPDTPGECSRLHGKYQPRQAMLTPYDPHSVMNYCNSNYNNNGELSELDIKSVQAMYGKRLD